MVSCHGLDMNKATACSLTMSGRLHAWQLPSVAVPLVAYLEAKGRDNGDGNFSEGMQGTATVKSVASRVQLPWES